MRNPKIFISYARDKFEIAQFLESALRQKGYSVFFDRQTIKVGDSFPNRIKDFLKICDGVIILISNSSIKSEWCRYEYHYSFFSRKVLIPIITEELETGTKNPLSYFQKDVNYTYWDDSLFNETHLTLGKINDKLQSVKKENLKKITKRIILYFLLPAVLLFLLFRFGVKEINSYKYEKEKENFIVDIRNSKHLYNTDELKAINDKFKNDQDLAGKLSVLSDNDKATEYARLNSEILVGQLLSTFNLSSKNQIENIEWKNTNASNYKLTDKVFLNCQMKDAKFSNVSLSNIAFTNSKLTNLSFIQCNFTGVLVNPKEASLLNFSGCKFIGCSISLSNFLNVLFSSQLSNNPTVVDASMSTFFENCLFESEFKKDSPNSFDFTRIAAVKFSKINFSNCSFKGHFDEDWFEECGFYDCTFTEPDIIPFLKVKNDVGN